MNYNKNAVLTGQTGRKDVNMTESEAIEKLRAYHKCQRLQVSGQKLEGSDEE